jgi:hypothetical protein
MGKPAPCVRACVDTVDEASREQSPSHGMSTRPRAWLALCGTAVLVTHAMGWARLARASLGTYALAALAWRLRHRKIPGDELVGASVRVLRRPDGRPWGSLVIDDPDHKRSKAAHTLAHLSKRRDKESGGYVGGQSLLFLLVVTPTLTLPGGVTFDQPAPEWSAW